MNFKELFIDKSRTLIVNTDLALVLGDLNEAIVLNQLNYWIEINKKAEKNQRVTFEVIQSDRGEKAGYVCVEA